MEQNILVSFLLIASILFIIPKFFQRFKIPSPTTEIALGIILGISFSTVFYPNDLLKILGSIGIICFFIYSGIDVDLRFINRNRRVVIESLFIRAILIFMISYSFFYFFGFGIQKAGLLALAMITPSAGFILANLDSFKLSRNIRRFVQAKVIAAEIICLVLLIVFFYVGEPLKALIIIGAVALWILLLPRILTFFYEKFFAKIINLEFPLIFFVGLMSAFLTEFLGLHFILGAFIAGMFIENFLEHLHKGNKIKKSQKKQLVETFRFMAYIFLPFYFFSVGLKITRDSLDLNLIFIALMIFISVSSAGVLLHYLHRRMRFKNNKLQDLKIAMLLLPTLIFTIVIAEILFEKEIIDIKVFTIMLYYAIFSSFIPLIAGLFGIRVKSNKK